MSHSKRSVLLADIGNTSVEFALAEGQSIKKSVRIKTSEAISGGLNVIRKNFPLDKIGGVVLAGVVPRVTTYFKHAIPAKLRLPTHVIGVDIKPAIANRYHDPKQVGVDRLMNAVGYLKRHKGPGIIIDFGTAITFDVVSRKGEYLGGVIAPGIEISIEALYRKTALLPKISLTKPSGILGRSTEESIRAGCSYGIGGLCDRIVMEIRKKIGVGARVVATGGYAKFMSDYCHSIQAIYPNLVLEGILASYTNHRS